MNTSIGNKLKELRKQKGLSQEQVSEVLKISQSAYARIEKGESGSWAMHLNKIAELYEVTPEDIVKNETITVNSNQQGGQSTNAVIINQLSEKLIEQYEARLKEKDELINLLQEQNNYLKEEIALLKQKH
jgi:transcriptional regulator with XRE-family HTH domain